MIIEFNKLHWSKEEVAKEKTDQSCPSNADLKAMEAGLKYIVEHKGKDKIPKKPVVSVFTTFENNYHIACGLKEPVGDNIKGFKKSLDGLAEKIEEAPKKNAVKYYWIPNDFKDRMGDLNEYLKD